MHNIELKEREYSFPENIDEMVLDTYEKIEAYILDLREKAKENKEKKSEFTYSEVIDILSIATGIEKEIFINPETPDEFFNIIFDLMKWVFSISVKDTQPKLNLSIFGKRYFYDTSANVEIQEWADMDYVLKEYPQNSKLSAVLAIRLRPMANIKYKIKDDKGEEIWKEEYKIEPYDGDKLDERIAIFKEAPVSEVLPIINFFLTKEEQSLNLIQTYFLGLASAQEKQEQIVSYLKNTDGTHKLSPLLRKTYLKLSQFYTKELSKHYNFFHTVLTNRISNMKKEKIEEDNN